MKTVKKMLELKSRIYDKIRPYEWSNEVTEDLYQVWRLLDDNLIIFAILRDLQQQYKS